MILCIEIIIEYWENRNIFYICKGIYKVIGYKINIELVVFYILYDFILIK